MFTDLQVTACPSAAPLFTTFSTTQVMSIPAFSTTPVNTAIVAYCYDTTGSETEFEVSYDDGAATAAVSAASSCPFSASCTQITLTCMSNGNYDIAAQDPTYGLVTGPVSTPGAITCEDILPEGSGSGFGPTSGSGSGSGSGYRMLKLKF